MLNTYGIRSVNRNTFNPEPYDDVFFLRAKRNVVVTALRINNVVLNVLGYMPAVSFVSGCVRMAIGASIIGITLIIGDPKAHSGAITGRFYREAILTGVAQIARGALEALVPFGWVANVALDFLATPFNLKTEFKESRACPSGCMDCDKHAHKDPNYPFPFQILYVA